MSRADRDGPPTAGEVLADLERKPEYVERQRALAARREDNRRRYLEAASGLLADLRAAGFDVETMAQLRPGGRETRPALPALLRWLPRVDYTPLKRDIIATLARPWARPEAAPALIEEFRRIDPGQDPPGGIRWSICDALDRVAGDPVAEPLLEIAADTRHGDQRGFAVAALGKMRTKREQVIPVLMDLLHDDDVTGFAVMALGRLKAVEAGPAIERLVDDPREQVRTEARRALAKLHKQERAGS